MSKVITIALAPIFILVSIMFIVFGSTNLNIVIDDYTVTDSYKTILSDNKNIQGNVKLSSEAVTGDTLSGNYDLSNLEAEIAKIEHGPWILECCKKWGIDAVWFCAICSEESNFGDDSIIPGASRQFAGYIYSDPQNVLRTQAGIPGADITDINNNILLGTTVFKNYLDYTESHEASGDSSNPLGKSYMYATLRYGNGYQDDMWTQRIEGYTAYNCIRATYKAYISGDIPVGQSAWDVYADYRNSHANGDNKVVDLN